jgi:ABC-type oligopeptide transport system substrate-binding subunit
MGTKERAGRWRARGRWLAVALSVAGAACAASSDDYYGTTAPRHAPDVIWSNLAAEPEWIDPGKTSDSGGGTIVSNVFEGLTHPHPVTLEPLPAIAARWDVRDDGRTYLFHLRASTWSDGTPLTARDFEYAWKRVLDQATASKYASFLYPLLHAEAYHQGAVLVRGLPATVPEDEVRAAAARFGAVDAVKLAPDLGGAFVMPGGDESAKDALRAALVRGLDGATIAGARVSAQVTPAAVVGVRAIDDHTLEARLEAPLPYFLHLVGFYTSMPVPRHLLERLAREGKNPDLWTRPEHLVANGPYLIEEWKFRQYYLLRKNQRYWDTANVRTERIRLALVDNANTTLNLYEAGELDTIGNNAALPSEFMDHLRRYKDFRSGPYLANYFYWINTKAKPFDDVRVRQAFKLAIDRAALVKHVARGGQIPSADITPDGVGGYRGPRSPVFDPERARRLLAEAGYPGGKGLPRVTFVYNTAEGHKQIAEAVQEMWKRNLGVAVDLENQEWKVYLKRLQAMEFQIARMGWVGDYPDPYTFLELLTPNNGNNHSNWKEPRYADLLRQANTQTDPARRMQFLREAEALAMDATPVIPLYVYTRSEVIKPYLMGNWLNYQNHPQFKYWWIDERWYDGVPASPLPNLPPEEARP